MLPIVRISGPREYIGMVVSDKPPANTVYSNNRHVGGLGSYAYY